MVTTIKNPTTGEVLPQFTMYRYDQLNRLKNMKAFADFDFSNNEWNYSGYDGRYFNEFTYDGNGNIETAIAKNANGDVIDNQAYNYYKLGNNKQNNRLYSIFDDAAITSGKDLPSGQIAFDDEDLLNNNYRYNELGELVYDKQMGIDEITWGNNGKIQSVTHSDASGKYNLKFDYNHTGKRIAKHVYNQNNTLLRSEYYTRDASDNVMAVYRLEVDEQNQEVSYRLRERHIYGSSMLGIDRLELELIDPIAPNNTLNHIVGLKSYTGSNHLGNVLTTFSDKKLPVDANSDGMIDYYQPHIISSSDYAPFGAQLAERSFFSETYPNSFNDKRDDPELGDWQDYGMRMYSPWQRRFPTPDPLIVYGQEYPWYSPYQFAGNNTIKFIDLDGLEEYDPSEDPYFIARLTLTTFYDIKHSAENILLNTLVPPKDPSKKWQASYKVVNGKEIFETEFKIVSRGSVANEAVSTALDLLNIVSAGRMDPADFMSVKVPVTQITRSVKSISKSYGHGRHLVDKNKKWNKVVADIKSTPAKFNPKYDADNLTITAWNKGKEVTNGKDWKVYEFDFDIGANNGKETRYIRVEMTVIGNTEVLHAHPISKESFNKLIKK